MNMRAWPSGLGGDLQSLLPRFDSGCALHINAFASMSSTTPHVEGPVRGGHCVVIGTEETKVLVQVVGVIAIDVIHLDNGPSVRGLLIPTTLFAPVSPNLLEVWLHPVTHFSRRTLIGGRLGISIQPSFNQARTNTRSTHSGGVGLPDSRRTRGTPEFRGIVTRLRPSLNRDGWIEKPGSLTLPATEEEARLRAFQGGRLPIERPMTECTHGVGRARCDRQHFLVGVVTREGAVPAPPCCHFTAARRECRIAVIADPVERLLFEASHLARVA